MLPAVRFEQASDILLTGSLRLLCGEEPRGGRRGGRRPIRTGFLDLTAQGEPLRRKTCSPAEPKQNPPGDSQVKEDGGLTATGGKAVGSSRLAGPVVLTEGI